jgi:hypothetical protein
LAVVKVTVEALAAASKSTEGTKPVRSQSEALVPEAFVIVRLLKALPLVMVPDKV